MSNTTIYLRYENGQLQYAQDSDSPANFQEMTESSQVDIDNGDTLTWKISSTPGELERIRIQKVNKKDNVTLPKGSWKTQWVQSPTRVSDSEYTGEPNGTGATQDDPFYFAYDVDYKVSSQNGWITLDPDVKIPQGDG